MISIQTKEGKRINSNLFTQVMDNINYNMLYSKDAHQSRGSIFYETFAQDDKKEKYYKETIEVERKVVIKHTLVHGKDKLSNLLKSKFDESVVSKILSFLEQSAKNMFSYSLDSYNDFVLKSSLEEDSYFFYKLGYFAPFHYMDENKVRANVLVLVGRTLVHAVRIAKDVYTVEAINVYSVKHDLVEITESEYSKRKKLVNLDVYSVRSEKSKYVIPKQPTLNKDKSETNKKESGGGKEDKEVKSIKDTTKDKVGKVGRPRKTPKKSEAIA